MSAKHFDLGLQGARPAKAGSLALVFAAALLVFAGMELSSGYDAWSDARKDLERQTRRLQTQGRLIAQATGQTARADADAKRDAAFTRRLNAPWDAALAAIEQATEASRGNISFSSLRQQFNETGDLDVSVAGQARSAEAILSLQEALTARPDVLDARILDQQQDSADGTALRFRLTLRMRSELPGQGVQSR